MSYVLAISMQGYGRCRKSYRMSKAKVGEDNGGFGILVEKKSVRIERVVL